jgi:periodic tryptophan protein 2
MVSHFRRQYSLHLFVPGQAWAAATTEGLLIYSLDTSMVFDPFLLEQSITPDSVRKTLQEEDWPKGIHCLFQILSYA